MESAAELKVHRANTKAFIEADKKTVVLLRSTRTPNGQGGFTISAPASRPAQTMRLIPTSGNRSIERATIEGRSVTPDFILLGEWNCDMQRFDEFVDQGMRYQVVWVEEKRSYETKGEVVYIGT